MYIQYTPLSEFVLFLEKKEKIINDNNSIFLLGT